MMTTALLIQVLEKGGWYQSRRIGNDIIFSHPEHKNLISVPDLGELTMEPELLNEIFKAAGLKARIYKKTIFSPANLVNKLKYFFNGSKE